MALPKVTYGNYNYGQYANPTAIKYKGGIGEGLAQGANAIAGAIVTGRKKVKAAEEQAYITSTQFEKDVNKALGDASAQNREFVIGLKQEVGDLVKAYKLNKISLNEYSKGMDKYNGYLNKLQIMSGKVQAIASSDNPEVDLTTVRGGLDNIGSAMTRSALQKQQFIISENETENGLNFSLPSGLPSDFKIVNMSVDDLIKDDRYYTPSIEFDSNPTTSAIASALFLNMPNSRLGNESLTSATRKQGDEIIKYKKVKPDKVDAYINENNSETIINANFRKLTREQKEAYFEDSIEGNKIGDYTGSEEQDQQIFNAMRDEIKNKLLNFESNHTDITDAINRENKEKVVLTSAKNEYEEYISGMDGLKSYFLKLYGSKNNLDNKVTKGSKPGTLIITENYYDNKTKKPVSSTQELDFTNFDIWQRIVGGMIKNSIEDSYPKSFVPQIAEVDINQAYKNFMNTLPKPDKEKNSLLETIEYYSNIKKTMKDRVNNEYSQPK